MDKINSLSKLPLLFLLSLFFIGCTGLFFYPSKKEFPNHNLDTYNFSDVAFPSTDGVLLHGVLLKPTVESRAAILYFHGNALNLDAHLYNVLWLVDAGFTVFAVDYRGYGKSTGSTDIEGVHKDAEAALEELLTLCPEQAGRIIVFGQSMGGDIAVYTVANSRYKRNIRALIVDSAFSSYRAIAREKLSHFNWPFNYLLYPLTFTIDDSYSPVDWIDKIGVPLLMICGANDPVVPAESCRKIFDNARMPKDIWLNDAPGHISFTAYGKNRTALIKYMHHRL